jgi:hypothetical protein
MNITGWSKSWYEYFALKNPVSDGVWTRDLEYQRPVRQPIDHRSRLAKLSFMLAYINMAPHSKKDSSQIRQTITRTIRSRIRPGPVTSEPRDRLIKKLVWILQGDQKLICILRGDQKVCMNITERPKSWYEYYGVIKKLVWILQGDQKVGRNVTGW